MTQAARRRTGCGRILIAPTAVAVLILIVGCEAPQQRARQEAKERWNQARAQVKAKLAAEQFAAGNTAEAAADLTQADGLDPGNPSLVPLRARIWLASGKIAAAAELLEQTHLEGQAQAEVEYLLGVVRQQQERWAEALRAFEAAAALNPDELAYAVAVAQAHLQLGQALAALDFLHDSAGQHQWTNAYQAALAECYEQLGDWPAAAAAWQRVTSATDAQSDIRERLAVALFRAQRWTDAAAALSELLQDASLPGADSLRLLLAECYLNEGLSGPATTQAERILQHDRDNASALRLLAMGLATAGHFEPALTAAQQAATIRPNDIGTLELVAALATRADSRAAAATAAARLLQLDGGNPVALQILSGPQQADDSAAKN